MESGGTKGDLFCFILGREVFEHIRMLLGCCIIEREIDEGGNRKS